MLRGLRMRYLLGKIGICLASAVVVLWVAFPFAWMLLSSFKPMKEMFIVPVRWIPENPTFVNYVDLWGKMRFGTFLVNSFIVASSTMAIGILIAILAGFACSRFNFYGRMLFMLFLLVTQMLPMVLIVIPLYMIMASLRILDTYLALIIAYTSFSVPFSTWMMKGYFDSIPIELEEAAMVDGCTRVGALFRVVLPVIAPAVAATGAYSFIRAWNEFLFALTLTSSISMRTLPVGLQMFIGEFSTEWGLLMAGGIVATLPVVILFSFLQKYIVQGLTAGAVKG